MLSMSRASYLIHCLFSPPFLSELCFSGSFWFKISISNFQMLAKEGMKCAVQLFWRYLDAKCWELISSDPRGNDDRALWPVGSWGAYLLETDLAHWWCHQCNATFWRKDIISYQQGLCSPNLEESWPFSSCNRWSYFQRSYKNRYSLWNLPKTLEYPTL